MTTSSNSVPRSVEARALAYGIAWVAVAGVVGGFVGGVVPGIVGLVFLALSGIAVGAVQWRLILRPLGVSPVPWVATTAIGACAAMFTHYMMAGAVMKTTVGIADIINRFGDRLFYSGFYVALVGALLWGVPQAIVLRETTVRWWVWILVTMLGVLCAWIGALALSGIAFATMPPEIGRISHVAAYWVIVTLPQAILIGRAIGRTAADTVQRSHLPR